MIKNISLQVVFFFVLFHLISWFRELSLLDTNQSAPNFNLAVVNPVSTHNSPHNEKPALSGTNVVPSNYFVNKAGLKDATNPKANNALTTLSLDELKGKPSILYFWAPWCSVCRVSMPNLESFHKDNADKINVVSIALSYETPAEVAQFVTDKKLTLPTLLGNTQTSQDFLIQGFPTYYVLDKNGVIKAKSMGYSSEVGLMVRTLTL